MARELPPALGPLVDAELASGERIAWTGQPRVSAFPLQALPLVLFAIPWTAFSVFWMWAAGGGLESHAHPVEMSPVSHVGSAFHAVFMLFGLPFVLVGLAMLSSPWWMRRAALRTVYVITDRRAFILNAGRTSTVRSFTGAQIGTLERRQREDGSGDLIIQRGTTVDAVAADTTLGTGRRGGYVSTPELAFRGVAEVRRVEELLRRLPGSPR